MDLIKKTKQTISGLYLKYIMATELYMVEPWEQFTMYTIFFVIFTLFWYFNYSVVMSAVNQFRATPAHVTQQMSKSF